MSRAAWWYVGGLLFSIPLLVAYVDIPVAQFIHDNSNYGTEFWGSWLEEIGKSHWVLIALVVVFGFTVRGRTQVARGVAVVFSAIALSGIAANVVKVLVCRSRPPLYFSDHIFSAKLLAFDINYIWNSFPSGHATTGFAIALAGEYVLPKYRVLYWIIGLLIAFGRVLYNVHYVSDVVGGIVLATLVTLFVIRLDQRYGNRINKLGRSAK
ncbi:MAG: phosphatase PAP2 family protein [Ignavibacteria bacterium]|nr:phosphatase PAP2 family protein [Ignavibacteria bacterium]